MSQPKLICETHGSSHEIEINLIGKKSKMSTKPFFYKKKPISSDEIRKEKKRKQRCQPMLTF
jgi:hypothetical protein